MLLKLTLFWFLLLTQFALAQVTITANDILSLIGSTQIVQADTSGFTAVSISNAGGNQSWDYSTIPTQEEQSTMYLQPSGTPFENSYPNANFVQLTDYSVGDTTQKLYDYSTVTGNMFTSNGEGVVLSIPGELDTTYTMDNHDEVPLPLSYGMDWISSTVDTVDFDGVFTITSTTTHSKVDAWGTIKVTAGVYDCLRLRQDITEVSTTWFGQVFIFADTSEYIDYAWLSKDGFVVCDIESQEGETNPNFTEAGYFSMLKSELTAISEEVSAQPVQGFKIFQNYPNPFNPSTTISYEIDHPDHVQISIYDNTGQHIRTLINEFQVAGTHSIRWNAQGLASGVYYYQISGSGFKAMRKSILLK